MTQENSNARRDEIDLLELFYKLSNKISDFIKAVFKYLLFSIIFIIRHLHYLILAMVVGGVIGYGLFKSTKRYYSSDMIAESNGISNSDMINYINDLHPLCLESNKSSLSNALAISDSISQKIKDIQAYYFIDINKDRVGDYVDFDNNFDLKDTTQRRLGDRFYLKLEVYDNTVFPFVRDGILKYIKQNPYLLKLNEIRKRELRNMINQTEAEIGKLDSLQKTEYFQKKNKELRASRESQLMFLAESPSQLYYKDILSLYSRKQSYEKELELSQQPITVIKDFTPLDEAENPKSVYILKYGLIFFGLGLLIILIIRNRRRLKEVMANNR